MAPSYKLYYFNSRGRAEYIRYIFAYAGVEFEDIRIAKEKWPEVKKKMPFGMVPALELEDHRLMGQSLAIARYLARKFNLAGKNDEESFECDALVDTLADLKQAIYQIRKTPANEEGKATLMKDTIPFYLDQFESRLAQNGSYIVGSEITWADFVFAASLENFEVIFGKDALKKYPLLRSLRERVAELPGIKEWISNRPITEF